MFERYITDALTTHFGHIVESVDADKMQLSAWKGELELHDVTLKTNALDTILKQECPIEIAFGYIGNFQVKIPWSLLSAQLLNWQKDSSSSEPRLLESSACSIVLSDVNILITPRRKVDEEVSPSNEDDDTQEGDDDSEMRRRVKKEREVQSLLDANLLKRVTESSVSSSRWTWLQNWISSLLSTLSVTIRNIHIRYEDPGTCMGFQWKADLKEYGNNSSNRPRHFSRHQRYRPAFSVGITLKKFSVQSVADSSAMKAVVGTVTSIDDISETVKAHEEALVTEDDTTTVSSKISSSSTERETLESTNQTQQVDNVRSSFVKRYKLAAAEHLAIYWDSDSNLICMNTTQEHQNLHPEQQQRQDVLRMYRETFAILNEGQDYQLPPSSDFNLARYHHRDKHSYLLEPISPSVHLTLVSRATNVAPQTIDEGSRAKSETSQRTTQNSSTKGLSRQEFPPSSIQIDLPPCKFTFARSNLEDGVYLRKSFSVWNDATKTFLSEETLRRLARLRPVQSPLEDPKSWWLYAFEATKALVRVEQQSRVDVEHGRKRKVRAIMSTEDLNRPVPLTRRRGWFGLVQAVSRRRKYVRMYECLTECSKSQNASAEADIHQALLSMEDDLFPEEIVSFRMYVYEILSRRSDAVAAEDAVDGTSSDGANRQAIERLSGESDEEILSVRHRRWMMNEMKLALDRERANRESQAAESDRLSSKAALQYDKTNPVVWSSSLVCRELAIQINDQILNHRHSGKSKTSTPVVRMSSALIQDQSWKKDGSWISTWSIASLEVKDLISSRGQVALPTHFSTLLGRKTGASASKNDEFIIINGVRYHRSISVTVSKRLHWPTEGPRLPGGKSDRGSTTSTQIRVLPMEVVYSTLPVEAVTRVLATVRTPEIVDDYHKILAAANSWREEQKRKLIDALAHKNKKIIVDIDVGAPELLIPEDIYRSDSPMLSIDLGRIQAYNDDDALNQDSRDNYDDQWRVKISNMQVQSTIVSTYILSAKPGIRSSSFEIQSPQQIVEAFSIDFAVSTRISNDYSSKTGAPSKVHVSGTLPRLAFNLTSSAICLGSRLQEMWRTRKRDVEYHAIHSTNAPATRFPDATAVLSNNGTSETKNKDKTKTEENATARVFLFEFSAPLITLQLENDTPTKDNPKIVPLFDLAIGGISGQFMQNVGRNGDSSTKFNASLQSLGVIDLFQRAGKDYVLLMSSVPQILLIDDIFDGQTYSWHAVHKENDPESSLRKALVTIEYLNSTQSGIDENGLRIPDVQPRQLSIWFNELYVEWNPETLAAIRKAVTVPIDVKEFARPLLQSQLSQDDEESLSSEDEFFDAMEEINEQGSDRDSVHSLSEISSSSDVVAVLESTSSPPRVSISGGFIVERLPSPGRLSFSSGPGSPFASGLSYFDTLALTSFSTLEKKEDIPKPQAIKIVFELTKLRVSFNKETRHRKLMVAQMDRTVVSYATRVSGGSNTTMRIGNLVFIDPAYEQKGTLYGHILGLKNDTGDGSHNGPSSLLEMNIILNPISRQFSSVLTGAVSDPVTIDRHKGAMTGSDCCVTATFSPMRFVLIQQLWLEVIDYFFQGVIGSEIIGGGNAEKSPSLDQANLQTSSMRNSAFLPGSDANGVSFTRFQVILESPVILMPVTYASPEFLRLELSKIALSNDFSGSSKSDEAYGTDKTPADRMQWFNKCNITLDQLRLFSWSGLELGKEPASGSVQLCWPSGPFSHLILPKWNVTCIFDELDISSRRSDYALLQNIISYNVGEESRYMDEWNALQNLSAGALQNYMQKIIVHYGYDKKDVAPSTYHMFISIASLKFSLVHGRKTSSPPVATARCFDLKFDMSKGLDLIVKQNLSCDIDLVTPRSTSSQFDKLLSMSKYDHDLGKLDLTHVDGKPGLTYSSVTPPSKDSIRSMEIVDACIYMIIPKWRQCISFFQSLPPPIVLNKNDIGASIQVGDRWYRIGDGASPLATTGPSTENKSIERFSWINIGSSTNSHPAPVRSSSRMSAVHRSKIPTSQMKVLLTWPRIILPSMSTEEPSTRVILRMHHLDYLQTNLGETCSLEKSLFLHDVEVYTSSEHHSTEASNAQQDNSLIHPWSVALAVVTCNGESSGNCDVHEYRMSTDVLCARAAYSDMAIAMDVVLSVLHSAEEDSKSMYEDLSLETVFTAGSYDSSDGRSVDNGELDDVVDDFYCKTPATVVCDLQCDGFQLRVADDSGRHFAGSQDLVILSLGKILISRREVDSGITEMKLWLRSLELVDCLQPKNSQFRMAASSHAQISDAKGFVSETTHGTERKMSWEAFGSMSRDLFLYRTSGDLLIRVKGASNECSLYLWSSEKTRTGPGLVEIDCKFSADVGQEYNVRMRSFSVQWNPSTVIAVQRFLGRLRKESKHIAVQFNEIVRNTGNDQLHSTTVLEGNMDKGRSVVAASITIDKLTVCLNKEHQYRRLMELTLSDCKARLDKSDQETKIAASIDDFLAFDTDRYEFGNYDKETISDEIRRVLSVVKSVEGDRKSKFLRIAYKSLTKSATSDARDDVPEWAKSKASSPDEIDDVLSVKMATVRFTYLKERTEEILDYLSNGLPGKGMGATSRAAKGFISSRIQTNSFLQIEVVSPQIFVPQHEMAKQGLALQLGDVTVRSWFEECNPNEAETGDSEWWRVLSLKISGFLSGITRAGPAFDSLSSATDPIDLDIALRKPTVKGRPMSVRGKLSGFVACLSYTDYALLRAVLRDNVGRPVDKEKWDNVEKAFWMESNETALESDTNATQIVDFNALEVLYSSNARFVRYGKGGKKAGDAGAYSLDTRPDASIVSDLSVHNTLDLRFDLDGLSIKLRRDDLIAGISSDNKLASAFHYNVMLLRVETVEVLTTSSSNGDVSFNLSLFRLGLIDLGDEGRLTRERYFFSLPDHELAVLGLKRKMMRKPCPFNVLVEGYDASAEDESEFKQPAAVGPQFVISIDTCPVSSTTGFGSQSESGLPPDSKVTVARIVINHLSVNALVRPYQEIADFLSLQWDANAKDPPDFFRRAKKPDGGTQMEDGMVTESGRGFELKFVAHYPKLFFLADESDSHSRALVLRGLAVITVSDVTKIESVGNKNANSIDSQHITSVDAQLHALETYINPDVYAALRFGQRHAEMVGREISVEKYGLDGSGELSNSDLLGVALIQPVTTGIEFMQIKRDLFPTRRSFVVNIEPVSTMLSFEDLQLVEVVLNRWTGREDERNVGMATSLARTKSRGPFTDSIERYEIRFEEARLGLGLKTEGDMIVVNSFQNNGYSDQIYPGDRLLSIDQKTVQGKTLEDVVKILGRTKRPVSIQFERNAPHTPGILPTKDSTTPASFSEQESPSADLNAEQVQEQFSCVVYGLQFHLGMSMGLELEESSCGKFPVVSKILPTIDEAVVVSNPIDATDSEQIEIVEPAFDLETTRIPRVGAVVVAIDDVPIEEIGVDEAWRLLSQTQQSFYDATVASGATFHLTFQEIESELWGQIDSADISIAGISLTFIDDLNGRDMPLFRGKLSTLEFHAERGLGVKAHIIDHTVPSLLSPLESVSLDDSIVTLTSDEVRDIRSESILSLSAIGRFSIDYFHPRVSYWEPLLEPSQIYFLLEKQEGSLESSRPAQVALEMSDRLPRNHFVRANLVQSIYFGESSMVPVNITDAAADVLFQALIQWKQWRQELAAANDDDTFTRPSPKLRSIESSTADERSSPTSLLNSKTHDVQKVAAQKAAQAALNFAKRRGAETGKNRDTSKPFILRNRTGVSIAFVQQGRGMRDRGYSRRPVFDSRDASDVNIGEYRGLESYEQKAITQLADQEDAKFDMDLIDNDLSNDASARRSVRHLNNKVRSYEGRYPNLIIAAQAVAGVTLEPLTDLQVFKVGSTRCDLLVKKEIPDSGPAIHSICLIWNVEIEDNRRILTLSTAVRLVSCVLDIPIEIGVREETPNSSTDKRSFPVVPATTCIGVTTSNAPFYMPLWLALRLERVDIYVRPVSSNRGEYKWSENAIVTFVTAPDMRRTRGRVLPSQHWTWKQSFQDLSFVRCDPSNNNQVHPVFFSIFGSCPGEAALPANIMENNKSSSLHRSADMDNTGVISITLDSCLTIRNMLPSNVCWEVSHATEASALPISSASIPKQSGEDNLLIFTRTDSLKSGECTEVPECGISSGYLRARFKQKKGNVWSSWATLKLLETHDADDEVDTNDLTESLGSLPSPKQVNVEISDESFGIPLVLGVRIVPKMTMDDPFLARDYGLEVVVYAELWIRNITSLPLNFGCPTHQLHGTSESLHATNSSFDESVAKFTAESALMEIANLLEVGDKGTGLNQAVARKVAESGTIESLPQQEASTLVEEVFEYVEIDGSTVRRRWWASESFDSYRLNVTNVEDASTSWKWLDENWAIDSCGEAKPAVDGWESCRNLTGDGSFAGRRTFNSSHGFRRRRYFRTRSGTPSTISSKHGGVALENGLNGNFGSIQAFHQPLNDSFSREQRNIRRKSNRTPFVDGIEKNSQTDDLPVKIAIKCGDGKWSSPMIIPDSGTSYGVIRVLASRWPHITRGKQLDSRSNIVIKRREYFVGKLAQNVVFKSGCLASDLFELCYVVSDVPGEWGEFSRTLEVSPRFILRNDSTQLCLQVKQTGAHDSSRLVLLPGQASPFYWADFHLPKLVSVKPFEVSQGGDRLYKWSGGFDLCNLGMTPIRIRQSRTKTLPSSSSTVTSVRSMVEVRPGTGGMGINISLREENGEGEGSLFRIENLTPFPIWLEQDGMLANPAARIQPAGLKTEADTFEPSIDGDFVAPQQKVTFALDIPYRQGKYASRKEATLSELLRVRVALAPLSSRYGVEMVKVIGLTEVGETIQLNPSCLPLSLSPQILENLRPIRVLGVVASDGPTRVLKFCLMTHSAGDDVFTRNFGEVSYSSFSSIRKEDRIMSTDREDFTPMVVKGANDAVEISKSETIPSEMDAKRRALFSSLSGNGTTKEGTTIGDAMDTIFSVRAEFSGFIFSLVDSAPSEIAVVSCRNVNVLTRWNKLRTADASVLLSVGWLQVDNHVPSAPFKVAVRPNTSVKQTADPQASNEDESGSGPSPLLVIAMAFAPKHKSKIMVLRSVTVAPRDLVIALDLAFLVRIQRFLMGLQDHAQKSRVQTGSAERSSSSYLDEKKRIQLPTFPSPEKQLEMISSFSENQKMYFQGLTILPTNIKLSVAPARALTPEQASLEGKETAAIHAAVRKGDVLVGNSSSGPLGVRVGKRNTTPIAVVRGMFKSIVVDAILRLDGASLNFPGVFLRNHIATGSQLTTLLLAHYVSSLKSNVPALLGSLAAIGNPVGLIRGIGDGVSDFVNEPVKGFKRSLKELDPGYVVDGVARGTESLARHTVGGLADSASLLMETFAKYMAVVTLDRRYAQQRDRRRSLRNRNEVRVTLAGGVESGFSKLVQGFHEGVTGVVRAPIRGAEKRGFEGFAKGLGKGLLGLLMKPIIGITDAATDVMIGVKSTVEYKEEQQQSLALLKNQLRPRRPMYGRDKVLRPYSLEDSAAATLMLRTRCAGENYMSHLDMNDRVALLSVKRLIILGPHGEEQLALKYKHVEKLEVRSIKQEDASDGWGIVVILNTPRRNGSDVEVISCHSEQEAIALCSQIRRGVDMELDDAT